MPDPDDSPLLTIPNALSLSRIALAALVWLDPASTALLLGAMALAAATDVLDGWLARLARGPRVARSDASVGAWLDPLCDKVFVLSLLAALFVGKGAPLWILAAVFARDLIQLATALACLLVPALGRRAARFDFTAVRLGKATTAAQLLTIAVVILRAPWAPPFAIATAALGGAAGLTYARRLLGTAVDATS